MTSLLIALASGPVLVLGGLDPVELIDGQQVQGKPEINIGFIRHRYQFVSSENAAKFRKDPLRYAVQDGGACGKMGALTGKGSPDRFAVVRGKIFLFASDGCRETFLKNQDAYFADPSEMPRASEFDLQEVRRLVKNMLRAHGGEATIEGKKFEWTIETPYKVNGQDKIWLTKRALFRSDIFAYWEQGEGGPSFFAKWARKTAEGDDKESFPIHPREVRELEATMRRSVPGVLRFASETAVSPLPRGAGFTVAKGDIFFKVWLGTDNRIRSITFKDRYAGPIQPVEQEFLSYEVVDGIALPKSFRTKVGSGDWGPTKTIAKWVVNPEEPAFLRKLQ